MLLYVFRNITIRRFLFDLEYIAKIKTLLKFGVLLIKVVLLIMKYFYLNFVHISTQSAHTHIYKRGLVFIMYAASDIHFVNKYGNSICVCFIWLQANDIKLSQGVIANYHLLICESNFLQNQSLLDRIRRLVLTLIGIRIRTKKN